MNSCEELNNTNDIELNNDICVLCLGNDLDGNNNCPAEQCNVYCCNNCEDNFIDWVKQNGICPHCKEDSTTIEVDNTDKLKKKIFIYFNFIWYLLIPAYILTKNFILFSILSTVVYVSSILTILICFYYCCKAYNTDTNINSDETICRHAFLIKVSSWLAINHPTNREKKLLLKNDHIRA